MIIQCILFTNLILACMSDITIKTLITSTTTHVPPIENNAKSKGDHRDVVGRWLLTGSHWRNDNRYDQRQYEYEGYDGWYNNFARPDSGAVDRPLLRRSAAAYEDGTYSPSGSSRPNPLELSEKLLSGDIGTQSRTGKNALLVFFGQQVVEEILDAQRPACPPEYFNIEIPDNHTYKTELPGHTVLPFLRTRYDQKTGFSPNNPRQQLNEITPYFDGGLFYGVTKQWSDQLRTYSNGTIDPNGCLASSHDGLFPEYNTQRLPMANPPPPFHHATYIKRHETAKVSRFFKLGNPRGNENAFLLTFGVLWFRWHNYLAKIIRQKQPTWSSDLVFNEARKWTIATQQHIVYHEWLPAWVNKPLPVYQGYDPSINPQIDQFFQSAAFRFGHTLVVPGVYLRDYVRNGCKNKFDTWNKTAVRTCNIFWRPSDPILTRVHDVNNKNDELIDIDRLLMGMSVQLCEEEDHKIVEDLRGNVFGPLEFPRRDLMAVNIQRGRDHGLPDFNTARRAYGLDNVDFDHFKVTPEIAKNLRDLYKNDSNNIDIWVGGILETNDGPGTLFETIILDQFRRIRDGDRFWYENKGNRLFTEEEKKRLKVLSLYDIIMAVTKMDKHDIPKFPFNVPNNGPRRNTTDATLQTTCQLIKSICRFSNGTAFDCYHLPQLNQANLNEPCLKGESYDYFSNSEISFVLTFFFVGAFAVGAVGLVYVLIQIKQKTLNDIIEKQKTITRKSLESVRRGNQHTFAAQEWVGPKDPVKNVGLILDDTKRQIQITSQNGDLLRAIDLSFDNKFKIYIISDVPHVIINSLHTYDLVLQFQTNRERNTFLTDLDHFINMFKLERETISVFKLKHALNLVITKKDRQKRLEMFYRVVFAQAFKIRHSQEELLEIGSGEKDIINTEITLLEFADSLNMKPNNEFVRRMFFLADKDRNGFMSFREFVGLLIIFAEGTELEKAELLFKMYDVDDTGILRAEDFESMMKCFLETVNGNIPEDILKKNIRSMFTRARCQDKQELNLNDFINILGEDIVALKKTKLGIKGIEPGKSYLDNARQTIENIYESKADIAARFQGQAQQFTTISSVIDQEQQKTIEEDEKNSKRERKKNNDILQYVERRSKEIFWLSLYTLVLLAIFAERAYYYSVEREHTGLRRIAGYGVTITRGAASAMMFTYSSLLVTMCRNLMTKLRDTMANKYFPFDSSVEFHKYIAAWAFAFTVLHIIGHAFNFYHISTQTAEDLTCLFRNFFRPTHELPKFHYWCWQTMTGLTGILLTLVWILMYVFALPFVRSKIYNWFWYTHSLYPLFFILMILHGTGRLIQPPFFYYFFLGPVVLFTFDTLISISRKKIEIPVVKAEILPSNVTMLEIKKPEYFQYKSGQWVRIASLSLNKNEYHPFTLTSSPNEDTLSLHIRAVGPWTTHIRKVYEEASMVQRWKLPKIYLDGPYGERHQYWNDYAVSVLIGGGIGVTPFASIMKDISHRLNETKCKKVYFIWVSRTQKQFEWLIDILRQVEAKDVNNLISCHIFITQFFEKFDLRMILLYVMEKHYQRVENKSLFTNLRAVTHFGRPNFSKFFKTIQSLHVNTPRIGVFSCGPPSMTSAADEACNAINSTSQQIFEHQYKNF